MNRTTPTDDLIALICKALAERYPDDPGGKPGLLIAHLPAGVADCGEPVWYVAAQRFMGPGLGQGRTNLQKSTGVDLDLAIADAAIALSRSVEHQAELKSAVGPLARAVRDALGVES